MKPIFNVPGEGIFPFLMGLISGYPIGARIVSNLKRDGILNNIECERLMSFTNNSSPLFILGTVGISMFSSMRIGIILLISHIVSCILVGFCFRWWKIRKEKKLYNDFRNFEQNKTLSFSNLGEVLGKAISNSINSVLMVGGFIVLFSVVCSMLKESRILDFFNLLFAPVFKIIGIKGNVLNSIFIGIIELTNGLKDLSLINYSDFYICIASFLLGFGGISIMLQVLSICSKEQISIKPYLIGKMMQACFSVLITLILI